MSNPQASALRQVLEGQPIVSPQAPPEDEAVFPWEKTRDAELGSAVVRAPATPPVPRAAPGHAGHMKLLFENAPVAMAMFDTQMRYLLANRRWLEDFKLTNVEVTGQSQYDLFPSLHPGWRHVYERALNGQVVRSDRDAITQDGRPVVYRWEVRPWRHLDTTMGGVMISCERLYALTGPATPSTGTQPAPAAEATLWRSALPILALDGSGRIVRLSRGALNLLPMEGVQQGTTAFWQVLGDAGQQEPLRGHVQTVLNRVLRDGQPQAIIYTYAAVSTEPADSLTAPLQWLVSKLEGGVPGVPGDVALVIGLTGASPFAPATVPRAEAPPADEELTAELRRKSDEITRLQASTEKAREAEAVAHQRESRLRAVLELAPCGLMVLDEHARPIYHNAQVVTMLGRPVSEGQSIETWLTEGVNDEQHRAEITRQWSEGVWRKQITLPIPLISADGMLKEIEMRPVTLPGGGLIVMMQDVTDARRGEEMLRSAEAKYRSIVHENPLPVVLADRSGAVFDANPAAESLLGHTRAELRHLNLDRWLKPESLARRASTLRQMQEHGSRSEQIPVQVVHRDGYSFPVNLRLSIVPDATGQTMFSVHFFTPAADANGASAGMEMRRTRTDTSVLLSTDTHGRITIWSPEAQERFGFEESEVLGRGLHTLFRPSDATDFYAELLAIRETSQEPTRVVEWTFFHKTEGRQTGPFIIQLDGGADLSIVLLEEVTVLSPPTAPESAVEGGTPQPAAVATASPAPLRPTGEDLKRERLLLGETHHRVKNHLQIITSMLNLQISTLHQEDAREALRSSQNRVRSIAALHQHLFQLVTGEASDFRAFAEGLIDHLRECYQVEESRVGLQLSLPDQPVPEEWLMPLALALNEMISNAFKHAFPDGQKGNMRVEFTWDNVRAELTVVDDGIGTPTGPAQHDNTGLGLKILRVFAGQLGGEIRTHSAPGQGSVFQLRFPSTAELGAS